MAKILYAVMGDARGHLSRSLSVAQHMPQHEYLFLGGGAVLELREMGYNVEEAPMLATYYKEGRVDFGRTVGNAVRTLCSRRSIVARLAAIIEAFDPDLILSDYEHFTPLAARRLGRPCYSLDHQHLLTHCRYAHPPGNTLARWMTFAPILGLYSNATRYLVSSFYQLPPKSDDTEVVPPILRSLVKNYKPRQEDHALVYFSGGVYSSLLPYLEGRKQKYHVYGFGQLPERGNLIFRPTSTEGFMEDLASCCYVVSNGGHSLISEALFFGKPIVCIPIHFLYEQILNAHFLAACGFGEYVMAPAAVVGMCEAMEARREEYAERIKAQDFWGNDCIATRLQELIEAGRGGNAALGQ